MIMMGIAATNVNVKGTMNVVPLAVIKQTKD